LVLAQKPPLKGRRHSVFSRGFSSVKKNPVKPSLNPDRYQT
jgi:hypothetical protein